MQKAMLLVEKYTKVAFNLLPSVTQYHHLEKDTVLISSGDNRMLSERELSRYIAPKEEGRIRTWENYGSRNVVNRNT